MRALTSASNIHRRRDCPGSGFAEMGIIDEETIYSAEGDLLHKLTLARISKAAALDERATSIVLTPEQAEALEEAERLFRQFEADVRQQFSIAEDEPSYDECEQELIVRADDRDLFPGHVDLSRTWPGAGVRLIADWKYGFIRVDEAPDNLQLASYCVGAYQRAPIYNTAVAIIQPRNFGPRVTSAIYTPEAIGRATTELQRIDWLWREPNAPRVAGEKQCRHCKAKLFCDAWKARNLPVAGGIRALDTLTPDQLGAYIDAASEIASITPKLRAEARRRIEAGEMPGWKLQNTGSTKRITDLAAYWRRFKSLLPDADAARFMARAKLPWEDLSEYTAELTGLPQKKARAKAEEIGAGLIEEAEKEKTPKRI